MDHYSKSVAAGSFLIVLVSMHMAALGRSAGPASGTGQGSESCARAGCAASGANEQIGAATQVARKMDADPQLKELLRQAKGVFIIPSYGQDSPGAARQRGQGILLGHRGDTWSDPLFYSIGRISIGTHAGGAFRAIAMLLMDNKAVHEFEKEAGFSFTPNSGLTIVNYAAKAGGADRKGDVIVWTESEGSQAGAAIDISDIHFDDEDMQNLYKIRVSPADILEGNVKSGKAGALQRALSGKGGGEAQLGGGPAAR